MYHLKKPLVNFIELCQLAWMGANFKYLTLAQGEFLMPQMHVPFYYIENAQF